MRTLKEIEDEMNHFSALGDIGMVMDLVDEHGNTTDQMLVAIQAGDLERIKLLEPLGIDLTEEQYIHCAVENEQLLVVSYQVSKGADVDSLIKIAAYRDKHLIWQWAKCWKSVEVLNKKLPPKKSKQQPQGKI